MNILMGKKNGIESLDGKIMLLWEEKAKKGSGEKVVGALFFGGSFSKLGLKFFKKIYLSVLMMLNIEFN